MRHQLIFRPAAVAMGIGILLSPDNLILLGHIMGRAGMAGMGLLAAAASVYIWLASAGTPRGPKDIPRGMGPFTFLSPGIKGAAALFLSTGILVSAGFVFNEVFVYWFPNFGFSFLVLAMVLGIHLRGIRTAMGFQILFAGLTLACLGILIIAGLVRPGGQTAAALPLDMGAFSLPLLLWVGFDLARSGPGRDMGNAPAVTTIAGAGVLFLLWGLVCAFFLPGEKLMASGVPHMKTARAVLGETGRYIMGAGVIFGTLSAVNALFLGCRYEAGRWSDRGVVPALLASGIGLMMALGMAGSQTLEYWIRAALLLWLCTYIRPGDSQGRLVLSAILAAGAAAVIFTGERSLSIILYMCLILGAGITPGLIISQITTNMDIKHQRSKP